MSSIFALSLALSEATSFGKLELYCRYSKHLWFSGHFLDFLTVSPSAASRRGTDATRRGTNGEVVPIVVALSPGQSVTVESVGVETAAVVLGQPAPIVSKVLEGAGFFRSFLVISSRDFPAESRWFQNQVNTSLHYYTSSTKSTKRISHVLPPHCWFIRLLQSIHN